MPAKQLNLTLLDHLDQSQHLLVISFGILDMVLTTDPVPMPDDRQDIHQQYEFLFR